MGLGGGSRKGAVLCSWQYVGPFHDFIVKRDEESGDIDAGNAPRAVIQDDIFTFIISASFTSLICLVRQV